MTSLSSQIDSGAVGSKLRRTVDGAYFESPSAAPVAIDAGDAFLCTPVGTLLTVVTTSPLAITAVTPALADVPRHDTATPSQGTANTVTGVTSVTAFLAGITSFNATYRSA